MGVNPGFFFSGCDGTMNRSQVLVFIIQGDGDLSHTTLVPTADFFGTSPSKGDQGPDQLEIPFLHVDTFGSDRSWIKSSFKHIPCRVNCQTQRELEAG